MTRRELAELAVKLFAVWFFCQAFLSLYSVFTIVLVSIKQAIWGDALPLQFANAVYRGVNALGYFVLGVLLWWKTPWLGAKLAPQGDHLATARHLNQGALMNVAFTGLGVYLAADLVPKIGEFIFGLFAYQAGFGDYLKDDRWQSYFVKDLLQLVLAIWLILGSSGIARAIRRFRRRPAVSSEAPPDTPAAQEDGPQQ